MSTFFDTIRRTGFRRGPERMVGGVCGGIARATRLNVWAVRVLTLVLFLIPGIGIGTYLVAWLLLPASDGSIPLENLLNGGRPIRRPGWGSAPASGPARPRAVRATTHACRPGSAVGPCLGRVPPVWLASVRPR